MYGAVACLLTKCVMMINHDHRSYKNCYLSPRLDSISMLKQFRSRTEMIWSTTRGWCGVRCWNSLYKKTMNN
jgi:hypothetical protein